MNSRFLSKEPGDEVVYSEGLAAKFWRFWKKILDFLKNLLLSRNTLNLGFYIKLKLWKVNWTDFILKSSKNELVSYFKVLSYRS